MAQFAVIRATHGQRVEDASIRSVSQAMTASPKVIRPRKDIAVLVAHALWEMSPALEVANDGAVGSALLGPIQDDPYLPVSAAALLSPKPDLSRAPWPSLALAWNGQMVRVLTDPVGIRAAWWTSNSRCQVVGSTPEIVLAHPHVQRRPNFGVIAERLCYRPTSRNETVYEGLRIVGPGAALTLRPGDEPMEAPWHHWDTTVDNNATFDEFAEEIFRLTTTVTAAQMKFRRSTSCALHLSGGLDSSSLAGVLHDAGYDEGMVAFTRNFPGLPTDETSYQDSVLQHTDFAPFRVDAIDLDLEADVIEPTRTRGLPLMRVDPAHARASRELALSGRRVGLIGEGGDELYGELDGSLASLVVAWNVERAKNSAAELGLREHLREHLALMPLAVQRTRIRPRPWIRPDFAKEVLLPQRIVSYRSKLGSKALALERIEQATARGWYPIAAETREAELVELGTQEISLFLAPELIQHSVSIPDAVRATPDDPRALQRRAFDGVLPDVLRKRRGKVHFDHRHARDLQAPGVREILDGMTLESEGIVDSGPLVSAWEELAAASADPSLRFPALAGPLWAVIGLEIWFRESFNT